MKEQFAAFYMKIVKKSATLYGSTYTSPYQSVQR